MHAKYGHSLLDGVSKSLRQCHPFWRPRPENFAKLSLGRQTPRQKEGISQSGGKRPFVLSRRLMLAAAAGAAFRNDTLDLICKLLATARPEAEDEDFWAQVQQAFSLDRNMANFNNGGCSPSPRIVQEAMRRQLELSNQAPSYFMWRELEPEVEAVRRRLASMFGCQPEEMAITRNASEALEICLLGHDLKPGDEVLATSMDYPRMITTIKQRERRDGVKMVQVDTPYKPGSLSELTAAIERGISSRTKLMLFSHVSFFNGQIFPVDQICALGARHGIPVVVDGAHAFAQFPMSRDGLGCDFYGTSLHKWLMAPIGTGFLYVRERNIKALWPLMAAADTQDGDIRKFEEIGTHPAANHNAIAEALTFNEMIGIQRKSERLRYLRKRWVDRLRDHPNVFFNTSLEPDHSCAITNVGIKNVKPNELADRLLTKHGVFVTTISHPHFEGIRVTPNVYSTIEEIDRFANGMLDAARGV